MKLKKIALYTALMTASFGACAQNSAAKDTGWFVGGSLGQSKLETEYGFKATDSSVGIYGGFNFTEWFGLEGAFSSAEKKNYNGYDNVSVGSFSVTPKFTLVLNDTVSLYAKLGLSSVVLIEESRYGDEDWTGLGRTYGAGAQFSLTKNVKLRLSYDYISAELEHDDDYYYYESVDVDLTQTSIGIHYQF